MDDFGIGAALLGAFRAVKQSMRATGRTTRQIERYQDGDRIVFARTEHAKHAEQKARDAGKELKWLVVDPLTPGRLFEHPPSTGRTHFDHVWLEMFYDDRIACSMDDVRKLQDEASGFGEPHKQTREAAQMIARFEAL